ncbi:T9SS type A sorting domain-containing protein [Microscilla marina]|uniref:T9SS type A sorting domain-containing protein n=1 Tax=Microscilla marina TaxID=1027 RepID=UPI0009E18B3C|nr:T9SS type A sorting domain-containing protein [Microscilla marina]
MYSCYFLKRTLVLLLAVVLSNATIAQIIPPVQFAGDICTEAKSINVGDCNVLFDIPSTFTDSGEPVAGCVSSKDAWASFTTDDAGDYLIRYTNNSGGQDAAIAIYSGTCGGLTQVGTCVNSAANLDEFEATGLAASTTYYIRIMNVFGGSSMEGFLCVTKKYTSDDAATALAARKLSVNSCNVRFDVNGTESGIADPGGSCSTITPTANAAVNKDAWVTFDATAGDVLSVEYQADNSSVFPAIVIYRENGGPDVDLDAGGGVQEVCYDGNNTSSPFVKVDFTASTTATYYIRVINMNNTGNMEGVLCLYNSTKRAYDNGTNAAANLLTIGDCNIQFNLFAGGGAFNQNDGSTTIPCASPPGIPSDAWGAFTATNGQVVTVKYNNDNNDPSTATTTALEVYRAGVAPANRLECSNVVTEGIETITFTAPANDTYYVRIVNVSNPTDASTINGTLCLVDGTLTKEDLCFTSIGIGVGDCDVDFNVTNTGFIDNESRSLPACAGAPANYRDGWMNFKALTTQTRIQYKYDVGQDAVLAVYSGDCSSLTLLSCSNLVTGTGTGGTEDLEITTVPGDSYFIRVINVTASGDMTGKVCVTNVVNRDDCNDADIQEIPVGSCNVLFDLPASYTASSPNADGGCSGGPFAVEKDAWARFTGNGGNVTITYESTDPNSNAFIEISRGTGCGARTLEACSGQNCNYTGVQSEQVTVSNTTNGATYYIRVVNTSSANGGVMTGYICVYNSSTVPPVAVTSKISTNTCASANTIEVGDCGLRMNILKSSAACASDLTNFTDSGEPLGACPIGAVTADAWSTFSAINTATHTIEYGNENQDLSAANDVAIAVYSGTCGGPLTFVACANDIGAGAEGVEKLTFAATAGVQYYIRMMNISANNTGTYGRLCVFEGTSLASDNCSAAPTLAIGTSDEQFNIESSYSLDGSNSAVISNCVLSGAARKDVWARFTTAADIDSTITVVYDNDDGDAIKSLDPDVVNVGVAIYEQTGADCSTLNLVACANSVGEGKETITFQTRNDGAGNIIPTTYYIRVISTNSNDAVQGKISIFPYLQCTLGDERVRDGHFTAFDKTYSGSNTSTTLLNAKQRVQVFASEYGYRPDVNGVSTRNELNPEGYYSVANTANNVHSAFYAYGYPYTGWGPNGSYCTSGGGVGSDACPYVSPNTIETSHGNDANLLIVNGRRQRGKFWCQTIYTLTPGNFYVFSAWFNSLIPTDRSALDDPQLRITVCEGTATNPLYDGSAGSKGVTLTPADATLYETAHPGSIGAITAAETTANVVHRPIHPGVNGRSGGISYPELAPSVPYGAARACGTNNIDLKILNSDVFLPESPDQWVPMRCIYKAPDAGVEGYDVNQINLCIENISATANGNDFGIDFISFRECTNSTDPQVRSVLQSTNCELTGNPTVLGIPLNIRLIELNGILRGNKVFLDWITLSEQGAARFEIERAVAGGEFKTLANINAKGYSDTPTPYNYVDTDLPLGQQVVFYRLKAFTVNNTFGYSPIVKVSIDALNDMKLKLIPNPATTSSDNAVLQFESPKLGEATVSISSIMGVQTNKFTVQTNAGLNRVVLPVKNLKAGIYIIRVTQGSLIASKKLVVNR